MFNFIPAFFCYFKYNEPFFNFIHCTLLLPNFCIINFTVFYLSSLIGQIWRAIIFLLSLSFLAAHLIDLKELT